jgi:Na+/H+ antiporter NhaD/arsenite permease-like protein
VVVSTLGAAAMVAAGKVYGFYNEEIAIDSVEFETLGLLMGLMIIVALLRKTGFFEYVAIRVAQRSGGSLLRLFLMLGITTALVSMLLDNVTTVVLIAPMTVLIAELIGVSPVRLLISQAIFSNLGGMATLVGDPPNLLIGVASGLTFNDFLIHLGPIVVVVWLSSYAALRLRHRNEFTTLNAEQKRALDELDARAALTDPVNVRRILIVLGGITVVFFFERALDIAPMFAALTGASIAIGWTRQNAHEILREVEWDVLVFFTSLFVMVGGLEAAGILDRVAEAVMELHGISPVLMGLVVLWAMVVLSALVDNIPITIAIIPVILALEADGISVQPLWWAVALGAGLGGNATPIGATANVVVIAMSERTDHPITSRQWFTDGLPVVLVTTVVASVLYALLFGYLGGG